MKILIVSHYFLPHIGGIENVTYHQAKELTKLGHQVTIVTSKISTEPRESYLGQIKIIRIQAINIFEDYFGIPYPIFLPEIFITVYKEIKHYDVIHLHGHVYLSSLIACIWAKYFKKKIVLTQHNTFIEHTNIFLQLIEYFFDKTIGLFTFKAADVILTDSNKTKLYVESILKTPQKKIITLYNGIDSDIFYPVKNKSVIKKRLGINAKFVCLCIRRITFKNGIDTFLDTVKLCNKSKDITFVLGGTGPDSPKVEKFITDNNLSNLIVKGYIDDKTLPDYYRCSDVFILPSKKGEGFPLVVFEAFSSGIPVISTQSGGQEEIIKNNVNGYIVEVDNPNQIAERIMYLNNHNLLLNKMSVNCRKLVMSGYSWVKNTEKLAKFFQNAVR
jgi:glycosyltransferase involved in cell wall biosynthesis